MGKTIKRGHWVGVRITDSREMIHYTVPLIDGRVSDSCSCSECGEWLVASDEYDCYGNYCPCCGADMREVEDGNDD